MSDDSGTYIDPALVKVSFGELPLPENRAVSQIQGGGLEFTWSTEKKTGSDPYDQIMMLAYNTEKAWTASQTTGQFRSNGSDILSLGENPADKFYVWADFRSADRSRQSDSIFLGEWKI